MTVPSWYQNTKEGAAADSEMMQVILIVDSLFTHISDPSGIQAFAAEAGKKEKKQSSCRNMCLYRCLNFFNFVASKEIKHHKEAQKQETQDKFTFKSWNSLKALFSSHKL